jgi:hypothetical protein
VGALADKKMVGRKIPDSLGSPLAAKCQLTTAMLRGGSGSPAPISGLSSGVRNRHNQDSIIDEAVDDTKGELLEAAGAM